MGVQPIEPGFGKIQIKPQVGSLKNADIDIPTKRGNIHVDFKSFDDDSFIINICIPANTTAKIYVPKYGFDNPFVTVDDTVQKGKIEGDFIVMDNIGSGKHKFERSKWNPFALTEI